MKVAVCLSGGPKFPDRSLNSIRNIYPNDFVKIFMHSWEVSDQETFIKNCFEKRVFDSEKEAGNHDNLSTGILSIFDAESCLVERFDEKEGDFRELLESVPFSSHYRGDLGPISMFYSIFKSNELKKRYELENGMTFDRVVRMRFDSDIGKRIMNLVNLTGSLMIPSGNDFLGGVNDQFALGSSHHMDLYSNLYEDLAELKLSPYHPESLLRHHLERCDVEVQRFDFPVNINNRGRDSDSGRVAAEVRDLHLGSRPDLRSGWRLRPFSGKARIVSKREKRVVECDPVLSYIISEVTRQKTVADIIDHFVRVYPERAGSIPDDVFSTIKSLVQQNVVSVRDQSRYVPQKAVAWKNWFTRKLVPGS